MRAKDKRKIRKSARYTYIVIATILFAVSSARLFLIFFSDSESYQKREKVYSYTNKFDSTYVVNLNKNKYINQEQLEMGKTYITDLVDDICFNFNYTYEGTEKSKIDYNYEIIGQIRGVYSKDGIEKSVWEEQGVLKEKKENSIEDSKININEKLDLDLSEQNQLVKDFEQELGMSIDAKYIIIMKIETTTEVQGQKVVNNYVTNINMDIGKKTTEIDGTLNDEKEQNVEKDVNVQKSKNVFVIIVNFVLLVISIYIYKFISKTTTVNVIRNEYKLELNRILRLCQDKIVQINSRLDINENNLVDVKDFGEIIKVSEELFKPILYWKAGDQEAWFCVMSSNITYRYILK